jgi:hypothetical protein
MGAWSKLFEFGGKVVDNAATRSVGSAVIHPQRTMMGLGKATKSLAVGSGMGYLAWETLVNDKPIARTVGEAVVGEKAVDKTAEVVNSVSEKIGAVTDKASEAINGVSEATSSMNSTWSGISSFLKNMTGGNGMNMFGNLFGNICKGNVSGMSILGLLLSGMLVFGRFGWLGKIAGALMSMMLIGNNSKVAAQQEVTIKNEESRGLRR